MSVVIYYEYDEPRGTARKRAQKRDSGHAQSAWIGSLLACMMLRRQKERVEKNILDGEHYTGSSK
jgi:hypothetical protein